MVPLRRSVVTLTIEILVVTLTYYVAARLGLVLAFQKTNASPVWPPSGIAFAFVLLRGYRVWPGILIGAFLANVAVFIANRAIVLPSILVFFFSPVSFLQWCATTEIPSIIAVSFVIGIGNTLEALFGAFLLHRFVSSPNPTSPIPRKWFKLQSTKKSPLQSFEGLAPQSLPIFSGSSEENALDDQRKQGLNRRSGANPLDNAQDVFWFVLTALVMSIVASTIGPTTLCLAGMVPWSVYATVWFTWWLGDATGILILTPLALAWQRTSLPHFNISLVLRIMPLLIVWYTVDQLIFGDWFSDRVLHQMFTFTLIPILVWIAFHFGQRGVVLSSFLISGMAIWATINGRGPFLQPALNDSILLLQAFIGISTITGLILAAVLREQKQAKQALQKAHDILRERAAELEAANKELEAFSYSVSHDLRAPLRSIDGFSQILLENFVPNLDDEGKDIFHRIRSASQHMAQLIDDLLNLSRVTRGEMRRESVDLSGIARVIISELEKQFPDRKVNFVMNENLCAVGDHHLLHLVLKNLLENAWKFTSKKSPATIEFGTTAENGETAFFVRDNGVGFDMKYVNKLFDAFQRLHPVRKFSSTGIGLATVQRIIRRHGGQLWAHGTLEKGATFYFTLWAQRPATVERTYE